MKVKVFLRERTRGQ